VVLLPHLFRDIIWHTLEEVEEAQNFIEQSVLLNVACYKLWVAIGICFNVECVARNVIVDKMLKNSLIRRLIGPISDKVEHIYETVRWQKRRQLLREVNSEDNYTLKVSMKSVAKIPKGLSSKELLDASKKIYDYIYDVYKRFN
jgi:hypothetical protein